MSRNLKFFLAFIISLLSAIPLMPGEFWEWFDIISYLIWMGLLIWVIVSTERKPLILGILAAFVLSNLTAFLLKHI